MKIKLMKKLFIFFLLICMISCTQDSVDSNEKNINTITLKEADKYSKLSEKDFLANELFNKPDKTRSETISGKIENTYYYKKKVVQGDEVNDWSFSFLDGKSSTHGMEMME